MGVGTRVGGGYNDDVRLAKVVVVKVRTRISSTKNGLKGVRGSVTREENGLRGCDGRCDGFS